MTVSSRARCAAHEVLNVIEEVERPDDAEDDRYQRQGTS